jgi:SAM-dependent methyltransferase
VSRSRSPVADLGAAWARHSDAWLHWAREPGHDSYWRFHRDQFFDLLPPAGRRTLDLGCGEGRVSRDLARLGHRVVGVDLSPALVDAARAADPDLEFRVADAAALPFGDAEFDCVVAFMSLQDVEDLDGSVREAARVLEPGGRLCVAVVHPLNSAGTFDGDEATSPFTIGGSYLDTSYYTDSIERDGLAMEFVSAHRPLQAYTDAIVGAGLLIEALREPPVPDEAIGGPRMQRWQRIPLFLHVRALKPERARSARLAA